MHMTIEENERRDYRANVCDTWKAIAEDALQILKEVIDAPTPSLVEGYYERMIELNKMYTMYIEDWEATI